MKCQPHLFRCITPRTPTACPTMRIKRFVGGKGVMATCAMSTFRLACPFCITPSACCPHTLTSLLQSLNCTIAHMYVCLLLAASLTSTFPYNALPHAAFLAPITHLVNGHNRTFTLHRQRHLTLFGSVKIHVLTVHSYNSFFITPQNLHILDLLRRRMLCVCLMSNGPRTAITLSPPFPNISASLCSSWCIHERRHR